MAAPTFCCVIVQVVTTYERDAFPILQNPLLEMAQNAMASQDTGRKAVSILAVLYFVAVLFAVHMFLP